MKKLITIEVENNPTMVMTIPINQIVGIESSPVISPYISGHLRGICWGYKHLLKVQLYSEDTLKIPIKAKDYNRIMKIMNKKYLTNPK